MTDDIDPFSAEIVRTEAQIDDLLGVIDRLIQKMEAALGKDHPTVKEMREERYKVVQRAVAIQREPGEA